MNAQKLAEAVVHWASFETLCGRDTLLSEVSLRLPVGQFLMGSQKHDVIPELPLPGQTGKKPKCFDFAQKRTRKKSTTYVTVLESKWVAKKARATLIDELFDDIYRLASLDWVGQNEPCERFLVVAGVQKWIKEGIWGRELNNAGNQRENAFQKWLGENLGDEKLERIYGTDRQPIQPWAGKWRSSAEELGHDKLISSIRTTLLGKYPSTPPDDKLVAYIWKISGPPGWGSRKIDDLFPPPQQPQAAPQPVPPQANVT